MPNFSKEISPVYKCTQQLVQENYFGFTAFSIVYVVRVLSFSCFDLCSVISHCGFNLIVNEIKQNSHIFVGCFFWILCVHVCVRACTCTCICVCALDTSSLLNTSMDLHIHIHTHILLCGFQFILLIVKDVVLKGVIAGLGI